MLSFRREGYHRKLPISLLVSPLPDRGRGRAPYPRKSFDFLGTPVSALRSGGVGALRAGDTTVISSRRRDKPLSFRAEDWINNCHFEPIPHLSFRAEGEKS